MAKDQLTFPFIEKIDRENKQRAEREAKAAHRRNQEAILQHHLEQLPRTDYENNAVPLDVRMKRHVGDWECEKCPYATCDHGLNWRFGFYQDRWGNQVGVCVCLKDMIKKGHISKDEVCQYD